MPRLEIKTNEHEWMRVRSFIDGLDKDIKRGYCDAVRKFSNRLISSIKQTMEHGDPSWAPLSQETLRTYAKKYPAADHPWYRSGKMHDSVALIEEENGIRMYVGIPQYVYYEPQDWGEDTRQGLTMVQLAKMLEFGGGRDNKITARPLFSKALEKAGGQREIRRYILESLRKQIGKGTGTYVRF